MAIWKRVTDLDGKAIDLNMENVCYMKEFDQFTDIHFGENPNMALKVKDKPNDIHMGKALRSM